MGALFPSPGANGVVKVPNASAAFYAVYSNIANTEVQLPMSAATLQQGYGVIRGAGGIVQMPSGNTAGRPTPAIGAIYYDTTVPVVAFGNGSAWVDAFGNPV